MSSSGILKQKLQSLQGKKFTGRIDVKNANGIKWRLYFCLSRLIWADGGYHPYRVWERLLTKYCPHLDNQLIDINKAKEFECWNYYLIVSLLQRFLITKEQALFLIDERIKQILFDIYQAENQEILKYDVVIVEDNFPEESGLKVSITLFKIETLLAAVEYQWQHWHNMGLSLWNPNFAPIIKNPVLLQQKFKGKESTYKKLVSLLNGKYPLIELADKLNLTILKITVWLKPYFEQGLIALVEVKDQPLQITLIGITNNNYKLTKTTHQQVVFCIDDSLQVCQIMEHIITEAGYQYVSIQNPIKALPEILKRKPDLIFLDLVMPIVNGYEICSQIRRVSSLKDTPIIILTSNDGMLDRVRSKIVGANGFLSKPIDQEKVLAKIKSCLRSKNNNSATTLELTTETKI
ncbi:two-component response regulator [Geminocystis sp. NIES-3708]|uniref:response regulator n=1 Tax=Geminocystis sp. NIES-3708 TaxID=1615909 RepID=UPI0005FC7B46|nr:response regulator [Geminocystis sp. NIES-3708]BAQ62671.1 two-component response regulator [Geminocystis sp. NIES-3708]